LRALIEQVCTPKQIEVVKLKARGLGVSRMGRVLGISREAVRGRLAGAELNIRRARDRADESA
jgi:DNA-binding CsgD family transcriptional regulator